LENLHRKHPNQKGKIQNPEHFAWGVQNGGWKMLMFLKILAPMGKMRNILYKEALKL
jgi:hypothetical protein